MARLARLTLPGQPHHIVHRGLNGQAIVADDADRERLLAELRESAALHRLAVHAYAMLDDRLHLLVTPDTAEGLSRAMQSLGRRYVAAFNQRHSRSGTLWDGRFRAAPLEAAAHLLAGMRFIELAPGRTGAWFGEPGDYRWSSASHHLGRWRDPLIHDHALFWGVGNTPFEREAAWRAWLAEGCSAAEAQALNDSALKGWPLGGPAWMALVAKTTERPLAPRRRGRPPRQSGA
ncbi:MAG: transposase [Pelomonas sp.]|nr:transposase [Roseateles sp.]